MDILVQKRLHRFFTLNSILARKYADLNVTYTSYRLKTNPPVVSHVTGAYRGAEVIYHTSVYSAVRIYVLSFTLQYLYIQVSRLPTEHKDGRIKVIYIS
jgi:hypothetical protein